MVALDPLGRSSLLCTTVETSAYIPGRLTSFKPSALRSCRVEERRGVAGAVRFPSPLIERSMRISRTTLSDWFHRGHTTAGHMSVYHASVRLGVATQLARKVPGFIQWFAGSRQSAGRHPLRQAHQKPGAFPPPALPDLNGHMTLSDSRQHPRLAATPRPPPSCQAALPLLPGPPSPIAHPNT